VDISTLKVAHLHSIYENDAIIWRFNGYWPTISNLY